MKDSDALTALFMALPGIAFLLRSLTQSPLLPLLHVRPNLPCMTAVSALSTFHSIINALLELCPLRL